MVLTRLEPSSAGWKINITVPGRSSFIPASTSAVAMSMAVCASCPHACMTETVLPKYSAVSWDANGSPSGSLTGSASMSARRATVRPGFPPFRMPTTPVRATSVRTSSPRPRKCSATRVARPRLLVAEFRVLVDVPPPGDQTLFDGGGPRPHLSFQRGSLRTRPVDDGNKQHRSGSKIQSKLCSTHFSTPFWPAERRCAESDQILPDPFTERPGESLILGRRRRALVIRR